MTRSGTLSKCGIHTFLAVVFTGYQTVVLIYPAEVLTTLLVRFSHILTKNHRLWCLATFQLYYLSGVMLPCHGWFLHIFNHGACLGVAPTDVYNVIREPWVWAVIPRSMWIYKTTWSTSGENSGLRVPQTTALLSRQRCGVW